MAQASEKQTISKNHLECDCPVLAQCLVPEVESTQVLVLTTDEAKVKSRLPKNKLLRVFNKNEYNARITEEKISINKYKGQVDARLLGVRNSMLNF